jgi:hypothetical protein
MTLRRVRDRLTIEELPSSELVHYTNDPHCVDKIDLQTFADESKADCIKRLSIGLALYSVISLRCICADPQFSLWNSLNGKMRLYPNYPFSVDAK